jgi:hypothetical protein
MTSPMQMPKRRNDHAATVKPLNLNGDESAKSTAASATEKVSQVADKVRVAVGSR